LLPAINNTELNIINKNIIHKFFFFKKS